jgi:hypothetical protein
MEGLAMSENYELYIPPKWNGKNAKTGRFLKGHIPANKGKKWGDYMSKRSQRKAAKGWKNLDIHRPKTRPDNAVRCGKPVVVIDDDGRWCVFDNIKLAADWVGGNRENVRRCCNLNKSRMLLHDTKGRLTDRTNTDHRYMGFRFYYENDNIWTKKVKWE